MKRERTSEEERGDERGEERRGQERGESLTLVVDKGACHVRSRRVTSCDVTSCRVVSCHVMSPHVVLWCHVDLSSRGLSLTRVVDKSG